MKKMLVALASACLLLAGEASSQVYGDPYPGRVEALMERSPTFRAEVEPVLSKVTYNTAEDLPGEVLVLAVPQRDGVVVLYFDMGEIGRMNLSPEEVDIILVHELYGHVVPQVRDRKVCRDPAEGQAYISSCVGKREARVLRELGMRPRAQYGLR